MSLFKLVSFLLTWLTTWAVPINVLTQNVKVYFLFRYIKIFNLLLIVFYFSSLFSGVYFDSRVEHVKFVDFCGRYRIPLLQYLCSPSCTKHQPSASTSGDSDSDEGRMKKVLLG